MGPFKQANLLWVALAFLLGRHRVDSFAIGPSTTTGALLRSVPSPAQLSLPHSTINRGRIINPRQKSTRLAARGGAVLPKVVTSVLGLIPWKTVALSLVIIPTKGALYRTVFVACHAQLFWPWAFCHKKTSTARITLAVLLVSVLKLMFGPPWASFLLMCYSLGLFVWADFVEADGEGPLPRCVVNVTAVIAGVAALSAMGVFPILSKLY